MQPDLFSREYERDDARLGSGALVRFDSRPYRKFERRMDKSLLRLVNRWAEFAAPNAFRGKWDNELRRS